MQTYHTESFSSPSGISRWLNSFRREDSNHAFYNFSVVGYVVFGKLIVITVVVNETETVESVKKKSNWGNGPGSRPRATGKIEPIRFSEEPLPEESF